METNNIQTFIGLCHCPTSLHVRMKKKTWERRLDEAKKKHRPKLINWARDGFATTRNSDFEVFCQQKLAVNDISKNQVRYLTDSTALVQSKDNENTLIVSRLSCKDCSVHDFVRIFEDRGIPCVISDVPEVERWSAVENWKFKSLKSRFGQCLFKIGEDDDGYKIKVRMKYFLKYLKTNVDDSPMYCFDSTYDINSTSSALLTEYNIPSYFPHDLFSLVGEKRRPPHRWFLVGPRRSGTTLHVDPLGTSAWNTSLVGRKRWILFPPGTSKSVAKGLDVIKKGEDDEAINYFVDLVPRIRAKHPEVQIMEFVQEAGDTVFVPGGWWHAVINLDNTIAITQVYSSNTLVHWIMKNYCIHICYSCCMLGVHSTLHCDLFYIKSDC